MEKDFDNLTPSEDAPRKRVIVVGGGASGLMAAYSAAEDGHDVLLLEKNEKLGKKLYLTGKGRCNFTNDCPPDEFLQNVVHGSRFLKGAIYRFPPAKLMEWAEKEGLPLKVERGRRVFPVSDHASDVTKTLEKACRSVGVQIKLGCEVKSLVVSEGAVHGVQTAEGEMKADVVIVATGGLSYPLTGSTGDGYRFARETGHTVSELYPSLTGIELKEDCTPMQGISLKNVVLSAKRGGKVLFSEMGELLFTHYGISGPLLLSLSALVCRMPIHEIELAIDFKPALNEKQLDDRLIRELSGRKNERMKNVMRALLPKALCLELLERAGIHPEKEANGVTQGERRKLREVLKNYPLAPKSLRGFSEAVITSGGISTNEIDPKTMESKKISGLRFCGETLDVDAFTGGYNLQIAFSSGFLAGKCIK